MGLDFLYVRYLFNICFSNSEKTIIMDQMEYGVGPEQFEWKVEQEEVKSVLGEEKFRSKDESRSISNSRCTRGCRCRITCKGIGKSGNESIADFIGESNQVMKNSEKIV